MEIPSRDLVLPSGATVRWRDIDTLLGADEEDVAAISWKLARAVGNEDVSVRNAVQAATCVLMESWNVPYLTGAPLPRVDPTVLHRLRLKDARALYQAGQVMMEVAFGDEEPDATDPAVVGSPTEPGIVSEPS